MPVPPKRRSRAKGRRNRSHEALAPVKLVKCTKCGKSKKPHQVCGYCGTYKGKEVVKPKVKKKKEKK